MTKSKKNCINKDHLKVTDSASKTRKFVECNYLLHYSGTRNEPYSVESFPDEKGKKRIRAVENTSDDDDNNNDDDDGNESPNERGKKRIRVVKYSSDDNNKSPLK
ncbi:hypothetical protein RhiirC2_804974 [Rhizophagus irregularis]|uniref:Uncharacterized protein n=1 Tax=Rhizophagus irregularis TaxID=588596 RepID=A0A2N1KVT1_9GLOM|nr:hypothetical protein RhiirC2_804974 [Rhizophagus irregularis]